MQALSAHLLLLLQTVVLDGGVVHPQDGTAPYEGAVVVVDGVIEACGTDIELPDGAEVIDASGMHVVPGLIDGMIHHDGDHDDLYVRAGIVLGRDMGNDLGRILIARARRVRSDARGPRLFICGSVLDGTPPITTKAVVVRTEEEAKQKLQRLFDLEVDFVATHSGVSPGALAGAAASAHEAGLKVWGPIPRDMELKLALQLGLDGIVGLDGFLTDRFGWISETAPDWSGGVRTVRDSGCYVMPVLNAVAARIRIPGDPDEILSLMGSHYESQWQAEFESRERLGGASYYLRGELAHSRQRELLAELFGSGVKLLPGSGAPNPWVVPGDGLHDELALWVGAGVPPGEVLRMATHGAAELLGVPDRLGAISPGLLGDLLVIEGDPRETLEGLRRPAWVVLRGEALSAKTLEERVLDLRQRQALARTNAEAELHVDPPDLPEGELILSGLVESEVYGVRIGIERYAVVKGEDGTTTYCSRAVVPASASEAASMINFQQVIRGQVVTSFEFAITSQGTRIEVRGQKVGGQFRVERRVDGQFLDTSSTSAAFGVVDSGSVTASMVVAHHLDAGQFKALYFEDLEPAVVIWDLALKGNAVHAMRTGEGPLVALFRADGGLDKMERTRGNGVLRQRSVSTDTHGGPGFPLPAERTPTSEEAGEFPDSSGPAEPK